MRAGRLDILVNNIGVRMRRPTSDTSPDELAAMVQANLVAPYALAKAALTLLTASPAGRIINARTVDRLAALTVPKAGFGYYVPPLGGGEEALVNILPITLPAELYVVPTPHTPKKATALLLSSDEKQRFDWVIKGEMFWSFSDPRENVCRGLVDLDQVESIRQAVPDRLRIL